MSVESFHRAPLIRHWQGESGQHPGQPGETRQSQAVDHQRARAQRLLLDTRGNGRDRRVLPVSVLLRNLNIFLARPALGRPSHSRCSLLRAGRIDQFHPLRTHDRCAGAHHDHGSSRAAVHDFSGNDRCAQAQALNREANRDRLFMAKKRAQFSSPLKSNKAPRQSWPTRARLIVDGLPSKLTVPGYVVLHQFEASSCYLLVITSGCAFEEAVCFVLVSKDLRRILASRSVGSPHTAFWLKSIKWMDDHHFLATFKRAYEHEDDRRLFTIREYGIPLLYPAAKNG